MKVNFDIMTPYNIINILKVNGKEIYYWITVNAITVGSSSLFS